MAAPLGDEVRGNLRDLEHTRRRAEADGRRCVVCAVIVNSSGQAFLQRRASDARLFPGSWEIVGGHAEAGESMRDALAREITEETGWLLRAVHDIVRVTNWEGSDGVRRWEVDVLAEVDGDLRHPRLEPGGFTESGWFDRAGLSALAARPGGGEPGMILVAMKALDLAAARGWSSRRFRGVRRQGAHGPQRRPEHW